MPLARLTPLSLVLALGACSACGSSLPPEPTNEPARPPPPPEPVSYEVHEWGLIRGNMFDRVNLSGPHRDEVPVPVAKPVLYLHRSGAGPLSVDVGVSIANGRIVEHWPLGETRGSGLTWRGVTVEERTCAGSRYPTDGEPPCAAVEAPDACEAATLATVETDEASCLTFGGADFNHLFYRGQIEGAPPLPLAIAHEGSVLRLTPSGDAAIPGSIIRVRASTHEVAVIPAPSPGTAVGLPPPYQPGRMGADALAASLRAAGLTDAEVLAFRRAWDETLFGTQVAAAAAEAPTATPMAAMPMAPPSDDAILYVLPQPTADALAPLTFTPAPRAVRRAIVAWIDAGTNRPARP